VNPKNAGIEFSHDAFKHLAVDFFLD